MVTLKKIATILSILLCSFMACNRTSPPNQTDSEDIDNRDIPIDDGYDKTHNGRDTLAPRNGQDSAYLDNMP